ncbi:MAG: hypothetical protein ACKVOU_11780 [Cytophagales bacterium]
MKYYFTVLCFSVVSFLTLSAQEINYQKLGVPSVDGGGIIFDADKNQIGRVDKDGAIYDAKGTKIAKFDAFGNVIEDITGGNFGKSDAEGNHMIVKNKKVISWNSAYPENAGVQICLVKNKSGKLMGAVNKVHKQYGTGAMYFLVVKFVKGSEKETTTTITSKKTTKKSTIKKTTTKKVVKKKTIK